MPLQTYPFDAAEYLDSSEALAAYLEESLASGDPQDLVDSLKVIARARAMHGIGPAADEHPDDGALPTLFSLLKALDLKLSVQPIAA